MFVSGQRNDRLNGTLSGISNVVCTRLRGRYLGHKTVLKILPRPEIGSRGGRVEFLKKKKMGAIRVVKHYTRSVYVSRANVDKLRKYGGEYITIVF